MTEPLPTAAEVRGIIPSDPDPSEAAMQEARELLLTVRKLDRRGTEHQAVEELALALDRHAAAQREKDAAKADQWSKPSVVQLAAGEMTAQELRTAQAVAKGIAAAIRSAP